MSRLGDTIRAARLKKKMTEKALGKKCGMAENVIKDIEAGRRIVSDDQAQRILKVLGTDNPISTELDVAAEPEVQLRPKPRAYVLPIEPEQPQKEEAARESSDAWLDALGAYLQDNLDYLVQYMEENIPRIKAIRPEGSYLVWLDCRDLGMSPEAMKEFFLKKARVGLTWGETYGKDGEGFERINIGCPRKTLEEGLRRIRDAVNAL